MENLVEIIIRHEDPELIKKIGEQFCTFFQGEEDFIENKVLVNYTQNPNECVIIVGRDSECAKTLLKGLESE